MNPWIVSLTKRVLPQRLVYQIQQWRLKRHVSHFVPHTVRHQFGAHALWVRLTDSLAAGWYDRDCDEPLEIQFLKQGRLKPGALVFDLGAHQGVVAMLLALETLPGGRVVAVEGTRHNAEVAEQNLVLNKIANVVVLHAVVSDCDGQWVAFSNTLNGSIDASGSGESVVSVTVDSLAQTHGNPDVVFLDIEGFECQALAGARAVLESGADFFVEVHAGCGLEPHGSKEQLLDYFPSTSHDRFIAAGEGASFRPWSDAEPLPDSKFFLIAQSKRRL